MSAQVNPTKRKRRGRDEKLFTAPEEIAQYSDGRCFLWSLWNRSPFSLVTQVYELLFCQLLMTRSLL